MKLFLPLSLLLLSGYATLQAETLISAARNQVGKTIRYDPAYVGLNYPGGDLPLETGVCTDVVIRALRTASGLDLQQLVHEDMKAHFSAYPNIWNLKQPDKNIDHRRVPNLMTFFTRQGWTASSPPKLAQIQPGDLITCLVNKRLAHIMIVSDRRAPSGNYLVIHNIGSGTIEEDRLFDFKITGHFRTPSDGVH